MQIYWKMKSETKYKIFLQKWFLVPLSCEVLHCVMLFTTIVFYLVNFIETDENTNGLSFYR